MEDKMGIYIKKISDCIARYVNNDLKKYNLTLAQGRVLDYISKNKKREVNQKEIEKEFNISHPTVSGIISRLESNGFILVNRSKRSNVITLLEKSYLNEDAIEKQQKKLENLACKGFSREETEDFINKLRQVYKNLKEVENND